MTEPHPFSVFVSSYVSKLKAEADHLNTWGAEQHASACSKIASDLATDFGAWWLADLSVTDAAKESGYSEERLREMARDNAVPHRKGEGIKGHITIARCDLPRRPNAMPEADDDRISSLEDRLHLRRPAPTQKAG